MYEGRKLHPYANCGIFHNEDGVQAAAVEAVGQRASPQARTGWNKALSRAFGQIGNSKNFLWALRSWDPLVLEMLTSCAEVFSGQFTVDSDRKALVNVTLGLWAWSLLQRSAPHVEAIQKAFRSRKEEAFPRELFGDLIELLEERIEQELSFAGQPDQLKQQTFRGLPVSKLPGSIIEASGRFVRSADPSDGLQHAPITPATQLALGE